MDSISVAHIELAEGRYRRLLEASDALLTLLEQKNGRNKLCQD